MQQLITATMFLNTHFPFIDSWIKSVALGDTNERLLWQRFLRQRTEELLPRKNGSFHMTMVPFCLILSVVILQKVF